MITPEHTSLSSCWRLGDCFIHGYRDHSKLHSFPTRRSSDLGKPSSTCALRPTRQRLHDGWRLQHEGLPRSEEHTSELQSRFDLVCRLLLEKKKNYLNSLFKCTHKKIAETKHQK